jgi:hypothetical protein
VSNRASGILVAAAGAVLLLLSVFADPIGIGGTDEVGWKQVAGAVVGGALVVGGIVLAYLPRRGEVEPGAEE